MFKTGLEKGNRIAFSLVEISVVIVIIGIMILGISKGVDLYRDAKLISAKNYSNSSVVGRIPNLVFWVDTTDDDNLKTSLVSEINSAQFGKVSNNSRISAWLDKRQQVANKLSVLASTDNKRPLYVNNGINGLPSLYFKAKETLSTFTPPLPAGQREYVLVAVFQKELSEGNEYVVSQATLQSSVTQGKQGSIYISLPISGGLLFNGSKENLLSNTPFLAKKNYFAVVRINNNLPSKNISIWLNKNIPDIGTNPSGPSGLNLANEVLSIGSRSDGYLPFRGLISEVIIFDRALNNGEVSNIITYLSKKYSIILE